MSDPSLRLSPAELVAGLRRTPAELAELSARMGGSAGGEGWSPAEVLAHLAHFEVLAGARVRMMLTEAKPPLAAFDEAEFNRRFADALPAAALLELFAVNRRATCDLLERLTPADWERPGLHPTRGEEPLSTTVAMLLRHDRNHLQQFRDALGA